MSLPGEKKLKHLFQPGRLGGLTTTNRIKYGACCVSNYGTRDGYITTRELARMRVIADTGCGIITNQGAYPDPLGEGKAYFRQIALYDDKFLPLFEEIAGYIRDAGAIGIQQILHCGRYGGIDIGYCVQPSVVPQTLPHFRPAREMTRDDIRTTIDQHAETAKRAVKAGFHGTELPSFMGYLMATFNSKFTNKRSDEYGGSLANRGRFMCELIDAIKQATPDNPLVVRLNGADLMDRWGGNSEDECFELMEMAAARGVDMISVTVGWQESPESSIGRDIAPGYWNRLASRARALCPDVPIAFGQRLPNPVDADKALGEGVFDFWEVCRPLLADPDLVKKAREDRLEERKVCVGSLNCLSRLFRDLPYTCTVNPRLGHEYEPEYNIRPAAEPKNVMVIGAGPAGMECAIAATRRGHKVTVFDRAERIGGCLIGYVAFDLANKADLAQLVRYYEIHAEKLGIELRLATEVDPRLMRDVLHQFDAAVIATGARIEPELANGDGTGVANGLDVALGRIAPGQRVVVLGANKIGLAIAETLSSQGTHVTLVEPARRIGGDVSPTWKWRHIAWIEELGIDARTETRVLAIEGDGVRVQGARGEELLAADTVIAAAPRVANQELLGGLQWLVDELHICGDAVAPRGLDQAISEGYLLGCRI
jgi:2,4-dienoyl-CoA reductase-like NADH-dependent reductase (Old Yellow Enzyme family)/thioredoxin reductase